MTLTRTAAGQDSSARRHSEFKSARAETHESRWPSESSIGIKVDDKSAMHRRINCSVIVANQMHGACSIVDERTMSCTLEVQTFESIVGY